MNIIINWNEMNSNQKKLTKRFFKQTRPEVLGFNPIEELNGYGCDVFIKPKKNTLNINFFDRVNKKFFRNKKFKKLNIIINNHNFKQCVENFITCKHNIISDKYGAK